MNKSSKRIIIGGGTGLIGTRLNELLKLKGYKTAILTRQQPKQGQDGFIIWSPDQKQAELHAFENCYAIINLAGAGVMDHAWTPAYRKIILDSRIDTNKTLEGVLMQLKHKPIFVSASAIGYYGYRTSNIPFHEKDPPATNGFLEQVTQSWEEAANETGRHARRHVGIRIGLVLSNKGGAFMEMQKGFKFGFGSYFSPGDQIYSWIHIDDLCNMFIHAIESQEMKGLYNAVAPAPATSKSLARKIAICKYGSARLIPVPEIALKIALGERRHTLIGSCKVSAQKILNTDFTFDYPSLDTAIKALLIE